ncbi:protein kinase C iota type-like [Rhinophrynus dorsalis]
MNISAVCAHCQHRFWTKVYKCLICEIVVHKRCHALASQCDGARCVPVTETESAHSPVAETESVHSPVAETESVNSPVAVDETKLESKVRKNIQDFDIIKELDQGVFSKVYLVQSKEDKQKYAMKVVKKARMCQDIDTVYKEKRILYQARECPFLVGLHHCMQTPTRLFYVMDYVSGGNMENHLLKFRRLPEDHIRFYAAELAIAIDFLHARSIIHRDLTLENILLDSEGHIKITDYGLCQEGIGPYGGTWTQCGTLIYAAPEILKGKRYGLSVDWWALGIILFLLATKAYPFPCSPYYSDGDTIIKTVLEEPPRIPFYLSPAMKLLFKGLLEKKPQKRLGGNPDWGVSEIKLHPFFRDLDWNKAQNKELKPPYKPPFKFEFWERKTVKYDYEEWTTEDPSLRNFQHLFKYFDY